MRFSLLGLESSSAHICEAAVQTIRTTLLIENFLPNIIEIFRIANHYQRCDHSLAVTIAWLHAHAPA